MSAVNDRTFAREVAGARAREEALMIDRLVETLRLASFRNYLGATVCSMSMIVPDVLAIAGSDVGSALHLIRPAHLWPSQTSPQKPVKRRQASHANRRWRSKPSFADPCVYGHSPPMLVGDAIISDGALGDWIAVSIFGDSLEIVLRGDGYQLSTHAGTAQIQLVDALPDTVAAACVGRPIAEVVDHPILRSVDFVIEDAMQDAGATRLYFAVGQTSLDPPWRP